MAVLRIWDAQGVWACLGILHVLGWALPLAWDSELNLAS